MAHCAFTTSARCAVCSCSAIEDGQNLTETMEKISLPVLFVMFADPHIKVSGHRDAVLLAKTRIMDVLDTRVSRFCLLLYTLQLCID